MKTTKLRPTPIRGSSQGGRPARFRLATVLAGTIVVTLTLLAGRAGAGASDYPSPLYLAGGPSALVTTSYRLIGGTPPTVPGTPTVSLVAGGALTGTYSYIAVAGGSGGPYTASLVSPSAVASSQKITVGNLPSGTAVDIYRQKSGCASGVNCPFYYVGNSAGATSYTDNLPDASAALNKVLPEAGNRINTLFSATCAATTCGYLDLSPGVEPAPGTSTSLTPPTLAAWPSTTPDNKGWIVDAAGGVTIPAGTWTFQVRTKSSNSNGVAHLVVGVWKVTASGGIITGSTAVLDPTSAGAESSTNLVTATSVVQTVSFPVSLPAVSLAAGEHLYVQFWRRQTTSYTTGGGGNRLATMMAYDSLAQITHPAASTFPNDPTLQTPADGSYTSSSALAATFSDPDAGDTGTVSFEVCSDSACSGVVASGSVSGVANGATASWMPVLADGSYYWRAQAADAAGGLSSWTATRSFTLDTVAPQTTISAGPADPTNATAASFEFGADEPASFQCQLDGGGYAACTSPQSYSGLADGSHTFEVEATDQAGNTSTTSSYSWTVDTVAPTASITSQPANPTNNTGAGFEFSADEAGSSFQCRFDDGDFTACTSPQSYSGLADGTHSFEVEATDQAGNTGTAGSYFWRVDTVAPTTVITSDPASPTNSTTASLGFTGTDDITPSGSLSFQCRLDGGVFTACTSPKSYTGLADGSHTFQVKATDQAGNTSTASGYSWTVDTTLPSASITSQPANPTNSTTASLGFSASKAGATFKCQLDGGGFTACTSPKSYSHLAGGSHNFQVQVTSAGGVTNPTPAAYSWTVDTVAPTVAITGQPANPTNAAGAGFGFTGTDNVTPSGSLSFQCRLDSGSFAACTSPKSYSGLANGNHTFQVKATDQAGNAGTAASYSWKIDTAPPYTPKLSAPADKVLQNSLPRLTAIFADPTSGDTGTITFRVCSDAACANVQASGSSSSVKNLATAAWTVGTALADGTYYWQAYGQDAAGSRSGWSPTRSFTLDTVPPAAPGNFAGVVAAKKLTLSWSLPAGESGPMGSYVVYSRGASWLTVAGSTLKADAGKFDATDTRTFAVAAVDKAGNQGPLSVTLVGVPNVVGMNLAAATSALQARGLVLGTQTQASQTGTIVSQQPTAATVVRMGSPVAVVVGH